VFLIPFLFLFYYGLALGIEGVELGFIEGSLRVELGLDGVNLIEPSINPLSNHRKVY